MADTKVAAAPPPAAAAAGGKPGSKKRKRPDKEKKNRRSLGCGMYKYGLKKANVWTFVGKKAPKKSKPKKKLVIEKPIGGEKNGGKRLVSLVKKPRYYPTKDRIRKHPSKGCFKFQKHKLRSSLVPGRVVILLAGIHKGRRAILLKQLRSGLLLINGPFRLNAVPLRRIHPMYVIATSTQIDISKVEIPANIDDAYFKRVKPKRAKKDDGDIFVAKKETYKVSAQRKTDQKIVDRQVLASIRKMKGQSIIKKYLCAMFSLRSSMYPHKMRF